MPGVTLEMVVLIPVPAILPGFNIQLPAGKPFNCTLPSANEHEGCIIVPDVGAAGVPGLAMITTFADATEVHPAEFVTV